VHPYEAGGTYLRVQLTLSRPLNPRPPTPPPPLPRPSDLIPKRQLPQLAPKSAAQEFEAQVGAVVQSMVAEWRALFPGFDAHAVSAIEDKEERRRALLFQLNSSGQYYVFKVDPLQTPCQPLQASRLPLTTPGDALATSSEAPHRPSSPPPPLTTLSTPTASLPPSPHPALTPPSPRPPASPPSQEKLKRAVVRLVRETMHRPGTEPAAAAQLDLFYNELYVTLTQVRLDAASAPERMDWPFTPAPTPTLTPAPSPSPTLP